VIAPRTTPWNTVVLTRLRLDERTHRYVARRTTEGLSRREIIRCLQRYVARELYQALVSLPPSSSSWPPHASSGSAPGLPCGSPET
jgi:hypothetical protein